MSWRIRVKERTALILHKDWIKLFKKCKCKRFVEKCGSGGRDVQCVLLAFPYFGRCYYSKCPKILPDWLSIKDMIPFGKDFPKCVADDPIAELRTNSE